MFYLISHDPTSFIILSLMTLVTYLSTNRTIIRNPHLFSGIVPILAIFGSYKLMSAAAGDDLLTSTIIPLGLSYYSLRCIHFILERYKRRIPEKSILELMSYLFFLPTIFIGPIHRNPEFSRDTLRHRWDEALFSEGIERIIYGYFKIAVLGNFLISEILPQWTSRIAEEGSLFALYLLMIKLGLNLYFQFSGFSDIAIGFARLLGFKVMENFNWPFLQKNISSFWQCWHISLTSWCRDYVYWPVVALSRSPAIGSIATLVAVALWHELSLRYFIWGLYHGVGIVFWQKFQKLKYLLPTIENPVTKRTLDVASILLTVHFVLFGFLLVRQPDLEAVIALFTR